jgi:hypothetical protein
MQVLLEEQSNGYYNFINSLHSESTKQSYKFCLEKFLNHYRIDLLSFLKLPQHDMTNLVIKYLGRKTKINFYIGCAILITVKLKDESRRKSFNMQCMRKAKDHRQTA